MAKRRHGAKQLGPYYRFAVAVLEPFLTIWTKQDRRNLEILERDYPPNDGIIVVVNHMSWFDPMNVSHVLWDAGRPPRFLAKDSLFEMPFVGQVLSGAEQIPVYRDSDDPASAIRAAVDAVNSGECVVIYPEGTMTRDPDLWPMTGRTGAAQLSLVTGAPVIPMAQWGPQEVMAPYQVEFNLFPRKTMHTLVGEPVDLDDLRGKEITKEVLAEATDRIVDAITELLEQLRGEKAPDTRLSFREWKEVLERQADDVPPIAVEDGEDVQRVPDTAKRPTAARASRSTGHARKAAAKKPARAKKTANKSAKKSAKKSTTSSA